MGIMTVLSIIFVRTFMINLYPVDVVFTGVPTRKKIIITSTYRHWIVRRWCFKYFSLFTNAGHSDGMRPSLGCQNSGGGERKCSYWLLASRPFSRGSGRESGEPLASNLTSRGRRVDEGKQFRFQTNTRNCPTVDNSIREGGRPTAVHPVT